MQNLTRIVSLVLILLLSTTVLQYSFPFGDSSFQKKIELCKKMCEDTSSEEDTSDDAEEDSIDAEFLRSGISIVSQLTASNIYHRSAMAAGQEYWRISTPPPRI